MDKDVLVQAFGDDDNLVAIGDGLSGKKVLFVLNREAAAPYVARDDNVEIIECSGFGIGPPYWPDAPVKRGANPLDYIDPEDRHRPVPGGVSVGNYKISAGTNSGYVIDNLTGEKVMLSNWHVLWSDSGQTGDDILQPGAADGGVRPGDVVANALRRVPVHTDVSVFVDCAIARMKNQADIDENIVLLGKPHGMARPYVGMWLKKYGRTTEASVGGCGVINASVKVNYGNFTKTIQDCIITGVPSAPGDSGSLMMNFGNAAVALLFAGGMTSDGYLITIGCRADRVEQELNIKFPMPSPRQKRLGIDVSKWQGEMDWKKASEQGVSIAIIRAGSIDNITGVPYEDTQFKRNAEIAPQFMPIGFYWYFRPNWNAHVQADYFYNLIKDADWKAPPVIDVEESAGMSRAEVASAVWSFVNRVQQHTGVRPMIYTSPGFWDGYVGPTTWAKDYPLWVANWVNPGVMSPLLPSDWKGVAGQPYMWQYRVFKGGGSLFGAQSDDIDMDTTYPSLELVMDGNEPPPPPDKARLTVTIVGHGFVSPSGGEYEIGSEVQLMATPDTGWSFSGWSGDVSGTEPTVTVVMDTNKTVIATFEDTSPGPAEFIHNKGITQVDGLRYRSAPGTTNTIVGSMPKGTTVEILETTKVGNDTWARIGRNQWSAMIYQGQDYIKYIF